MHATLTRAQFDARWTRYLPSLRRYARRLVPVDYPEDACQDAYLSAVEQLCRFDADTGEDGFARWTRSIVRTACREHNRLILYRSEVLMPLPELTTVLDAEVAARPEGLQGGALAMDPTGAEGAALTLEQWCEEQRQARRLAAFVETLCLSAVRQRILDLWMDGASQRAIGEAVGMTHQGVSYHLACVWVLMRSRKFDLVGGDDGYASTAAMWTDLVRVTRYRKPLRRGSTLSRQKLAKLH